jgi:hypothetical protein
MTSTVDDLTTALEKLGVTDTTTTASNTTATATATATAAATSTSVREFAPQAHEYVELSITRNLDMDMQRNARPKVLETHARCSPATGAREFLASLRAARQPIQRLSHAELVEVRQRAREHDVAQLLHVHRERLESEPTDAAIPVATVRGCLLRLSLMALLPVTPFLTSESVDVSVKYCTEPRALVVVHKNPRVQEMLYQVNFGTCERPSGHLVGALIPLQLQGTREFTYSPAEFMRVMSLRWNDRAWCYWAEIDGIAPNGEALEIKTRLHNNNNNSRSTSDAIHATVQSIFGSVGSVWFYSHFYGKICSVDRMPVPQVSDTAQDFVPTIAGQSVRNDQVKSLPRDMMRVMDALDKLFADLAAAAAAHPNDIYHVTITRGDTPFSLTFEQSCFDRSYDYWNVRDD